MSVQALSRSGCLESRGRGWDIIWEHRHTSTVTETRELKIIRGCRRREERGGRKGEEKREGRGGGGERREGHSIRVEKPQHLKCSLRWRNRLRVLH